MVRIQHEERALKQILQQRIDTIQREKVDINHAKEMEGEYRINKLNSLMNKLVKEKQKLEEYYSFEVREKQELVLALAKEKKNLTNELQVLLKEVRKSKHKIKKHTQMNGAGSVSSSKVSSVSGHHLKHQIHNPYNTNSQPMSARRSEVTPSSMIVAPSNNEYRSGGQSHR